MITPETAGPDRGSRLRLVGGVLYEGRSGGLPLAGGCPKQEGKGLSPSGKAQGCATVRPGGRFGGHGRLVARLDKDGAPAARMRFRLTVDDPGQAARVLAGPDLRATKEPLVVDGDWHLPPHAPATLKLHRELQR